MSDLDFYFGECPDYLDDKVVGELRLIVDRRDVEHDGYCSDAGEDTGIWKYDLEERYKLNQCALDQVQPHVGAYNLIGLEFLKKAFDSDKLGCHCGSGYCYYDGSRIVKSGSIVYKDELDKEEIIYEAKKIASEHGGSFEDYVGDVTERRRRIKLLSDAMSSNKLDHTSKQGKKFIETGSPSLDRVIKGMIELKWCFDYNHMKKELANYMTEHNQPYTQEVFTLVKEEILKNNPVPDPLPWI